MKISKKLLSLLLCAVMVLGSVAAGGEGVGQLFTVKSSALVSLTQSKAVAWARSLEGKYIDVDRRVFEGAGPYQCSDVATYYMNYLWITVNGDSHDPYGTYPYDVYNAYYYGNLVSENCNWTVIPRTSSTVPQPGDIFVSEYGTYGHIGIVLEPHGSSGATIIHQNYIYATKQFPNGYGCARVEDVTWDNSVLNIKYFIRFNYFGCDHSSHNAKAEIEKWPTATTCGTRRRYCECGQTSVTEDIHPLPYTSIGNGVFSIKSALGNTYASAVSDKNVKLWNNGFVAEDQKWRFTRNSDGTYTIESYYYSGYCMDVNGASMLRGANVQAYQANGTDAQKFYVVPKGGYYEIINKKSLMAIDVEDSNTANGTNISQWSTHGGTNQLWDISPIVLDIKVGSKPVSSNYNPTTGSSITISWGAAVNAPSGLEYCVSLCNYNDEIVYGPYWTTATSKSITVTQTGTYYANVYIIPNGAIHTYPESSTITVKPSTYLVSYDANGGTGAPGSQTKTQGTNLTLTSAKPTRSATITLNPQSGTVSPTSKAASYTFKNWNTKADGSGTAYSSGATYSANAAVTLYAQWISPAASTLPTPTRTGYNFKGWNTKADGTGTTYSAGANFSATANVTLYAIWSIKTYPVTYDANGGTGAPESQTKTYGTNLTLSGTKPTRTGYDFKGWNTKADGTGTAYASGATYIGNQSLTLYAVWKLKEYTVTFDANGGTNAPAPQIKYYDIDLTLTANVPVREGYTFVGWAPKNEFSSGRIPKKGFSGEGLNEYNADMRNLYIDPTYLSGDIYSQNKDITLYAVWESDYCIYFDANGGINAPTSQTFSTGETIELNKSIPAWEKGFSCNVEFCGWAETPDAETATYQPGDFITENRTLTLYAVWGFTNAEIYTVNFEANGGRNAPESQYKTQYLPLTIPEDIPEKEGCLFLFWSTKNSGSQYQNMILSLIEHNTLYLAELYHESSGNIEYILNDYAEYPLASKIFFGTCYYPGDEYSKDESVTLYAQWLPLEEYPYAVEKYIMNTNGEYDLISREEFETIDFNPTAEYEIDDGFSLNTEKSVLSLAELFELDCEGDEPVLKVYIDRNQYTVNYVSGNSVVHTDTYTFGNNTPTAPDVPKVPYMLNGRWQKSAAEDGNIEYQAIYESPTTIMAAQKTVFAGDSFKLPPSANYEVESSEWSSDNKAVAVVDSYGRVTVLREGVCRITVVTHGKDDFGNPISSRASTKVIVNCVGSDGQSSENNTSINAKPSFEAVFIGFLRDIVENLKMIFRFLSPYISNK